MPKLNDKFVRSVYGNVTWCACCFLVLFVVLADGLPSGSDPIINTQWGSIRGKWSTSANNRPVANFLGIPYALPPVDDLRFKSPQRWDRKWTAVRDGTVDGEKCSQLSGSVVIGSEDCLFLNVFVPMIPGNQPARLPIMVYVHGGMFIFGSSDSKLYSPEYLLDHDVILVTLNYRLGVLGFFSTMSRAAPGNYGLKDIMMALRWVQENIHNFGGDPESVTVMGSSAGAALIHLLALSNKSEGLFHRYILHGGSALSTWAFHFHQVNRRLYTEMARMAGCLPTGTDNATANKAVFGANSGLEDRQCDDVFRTSDDDVKQDEEMMKCMRTVDTDVLLRMRTNFFVWRRSPCCFITPVLEEESEDAVLTMHPLRVIKSRLFRDIPAIIEVTKDEGLVLSIDFIKNPGIVGEMVENFDQYVHYLVEYNQAVSNTSVFADAIRDFYFNGTVTESNFMQNITEMLGNGLITWPSFRAARYQSEMGNANVYLSLFAYQGTFSWTFQSGSSTPYGVCHADDLNYFFPLLNNMFEDQMLHNTENDRKMITIMTEMWTNFATDGVPRAWTIPDWPAYRNHHQFMRFGIDGSPDIAVQADFLSDRMEFWEKLMANVSTECDVEAETFTDDGFPNNIIGAIAAAVDYRLALDIMLITIVFIVALV